MTIRHSLKDSIVLKYREQSEQNKVSADSEAEEVFTRLIPFPPMDEARKQISEDGIVTYVWFDPKIDSLTRTKRVEAETNSTELNQIAIGGGLANKFGAKSLCTKCGEWVQYPHDPKTVEVTCWLCIAKEVLAYESKKPEAPDTEAKERKPNGKRTSIPKRKKAGRRNPRA